MDDPNFGVTVRDPTTGQDVVLSEKDVATIKKLRGGKVPDGDYNLYTEWSDFYRWDKFKGLYLEKYFLRPETLKARHFRRVVWTHLKR